MSAVAARVVDILLDRSVLGGYTRIGYQLRRQAHWPAGPPPCALEGRTVAITGGGAGLGKATAIGVAGLGAEVLLLVRDIGRAEAARAEIVASVPGAKVELARCDLANLDDVRRTAAELRSSSPKLDVLVHNAGVLPARRTESAQGNELALATHVLGPLLLTELLLPTLTGGRVIMVSSGGMYTQSLPTDDPQYRRGEYRGATAYARTKRIQVAFAPLLSRRWADRGISVHSMHPGWADTPGVTTSLPGFSRVIGPALRTPAQGADTVVWLASTEPTPATGRFWHDRRSRPEYFIPLTGHSEEALNGLWRYCAEIVGIDPAWAH